MKKIILLIIMLVFILFGISYFYLGLQTIEPQGWFIDDGTGEGTAIVVDSQVYTLNFNQQNTSIDLLNRSTSLTDVKTFSLFSVSTWEPSYYLSIEDGQKMQALLKTIYDPT